jgi:hypothetical protein
MTAEERQAEAAHHAIVRACAPQLLPVPFAHQSWHPSRGEPAVPPLLAPAEMALFGSWQFSINRNPGIRAFLDRLFARPTCPCGRRSIARRWRISCAIGGSIISTASRCWA